MDKSSLPIRFNKDRLRILYLDNKKSVAQIASLFNCSQNRVNYWLNKFNIPKRTASEAMYQFKNPTGDPFRLVMPNTLDEGILFGIGLALYWGEGTKRGNGGMRITNSDPKLLRKYIDFLETFLTVDRKRFRFSIQIPDDVSPIQALKFWTKQLGFGREHFYKPLIIKVRGNGTYKYRTKYGTVIMYFNNTKLKKIICNLIENIK